MTISFSSHTLGIVDNDPWSLTALSTYICKFMSDISLLWRTQDSLHAIDHCLKDAKVPDVLLVDMSMPQIDGVSLTRRIRERNGKIIIIGMTSFSLLEYTSQVVAAGAQAIVSKRRPASILSTIRTVCATPQNDHGVFDSPGRAYERIVACKPVGIAKLTNLENMITDLCSKGMTSVEIADRLGMSPVTVNTHVNRACEKMRARNRVQLVAMWIEQRRPQR